MLEIDGDGDLGSRLIECYFIRKMKELGREDELNEYIKKGKLQYPQDLGKTPQQIEDEFTEYMKKQREEMESYDHG